MIAAIGLEQRRLTVLVVLCCLSSPAAALAEDWSKFHDCLEINGAAVEQAEPSVFNGAKLIVDVICNEEAADLGNQMMRNPERKDVRYFLRLYGSCARPGVTSRNTGRHGRKPEVSSICATIRISPSK